jgi:diguanylate cyclase (GGDEF)-like protein/PAS domain S-box-containing protein
MAVNQAVADSYGVANPDQLVGKTEFDLLDYDTASRIRDEDLAVMQTRQNSVLELQRVMAPDSEPRWVEVYKAPVTDDFGAVLGTVGFIRDITERKLQQEEIRQLALYDALTQLPNRRLFSERVNHAIALARRDQARLALVFVDLDRFKPVNDSLGHAVGDLLLRAVARRMQQCVREADTIGRVGGDEFEVLLPSIDDAEQALVVAEKIRQAMNQPFELTGGYVVSISSSSGVAIYPEDGEDESTLSRAADAAMYRAKALGRDNVQFYQPGLVM